LRELFAGRLAISGGALSPGVVREAAARALQGAALFGVGYLFVGETVLKLLGLPEPALGAAFRENRFYAVCGYFVANWLQAQLKNTGAFEVSVDGALAFSKLKTGRVASVEQVAAALVEAGAELDADAAARFGLGHLLKVSAGAEAPGPGAEPEFEP